MQIEKTSMKERQQMTRRFAPRLSQIILAAVLLLVGAVSVFALTRVQLKIAGGDFTSIGILIGGLIFYCGVLTIISMFENETVLSIGLLLPSIVAVAIFVYAFIGWSARVSLSKWKGLTPDYTWVGLQQYIYLFHDTRFMIDVRNTAVFTVGFIAGCLISAWGWQSFWIRSSKAKLFSAAFFCSPCPSPSLLPVWSGAG
jgi:hypothetical protein